MKSGDDKKKKTPHLPQAQGCVLHSEFQWVVGCRANTKGDNKMWRKRWRRAADSLAGAAGTGAAWRKLSRSNLSLTGIDFSSLRAQAPRSREIISAEEKVGGVDVHICVYV